MHQWWGDNVSEDKYERTFFKEGYADLSEGYNTARTAANAAGGLGTPAGDAAFDASLSPASTRPTTAPTPTRSWNVAPSNPTNANLFGSQTYTRSGRAYIALRADPRQGQLRQGAARRSRPPTAAARSPSRSRSRSTRSGCRTRSAGCAAKLDEFFKQWWDTAYVGSPAAGNKPQITGPGLAGGGFYDANGGCSDYGVDRRPRRAAPSRRRCALTLGTPATFGAFTPGVAKDYTASHDRQRHLDRG